jgi:acetoin utilization deacetylase AcuC-like enzyme
MPGVDPHEADRLGRLSLTDDGLRERDRRVFSFFRTRDIPIAAVIGGGYSHDINALARRHLGPSRQRLSLFETGAICAC